MPDGPATAVAATPMTPLDGIRHGAAPRRRRPTRRHVAIGLSTLLLVLGIGSSLWSLGCAVPTVPLQPSPGFNPDYPVPVTETWPIPIPNRLSGTASINLHADGMLAISGLPWFHQGKDRTCAQANIASLANFWGRYLPYQQVVRDMNPGNLPTDVGAITRYMRQLGFATQDYRLGTTNYLEKQIRLGRPALVLLDFGTLSSEHYVTVKGYHQTRRQILYSDPLDGPNLLMSYDSFRQRWQNRSLQALPGMGDRYVGIVFDVAPAARADVTRSRG